MNTSNWVSELENHINFAIYLGIRDVDKILFMLPENKTAFIVETNGEIRKAFYDKCRSKIEESSANDDVPNVKLNENISPSDLKNPQIFTDMGIAETDWKFELKEAPENSVTNIAVADVLVDILISPLIYKEFVSAINKMRPIYNEYKKQNQTIP